MSIEKDAIEFQGQQAGDPFAYLYQYQFLLLKTFRRNGEAVATPVWFASENGKLYITTNINTGKVKRIRNNGRATMTPADRSGKVLADGKEVAGKARLLPTNEQAHAVQLLAHKYGFMFRMISLVRRVGRSQSTIIEIAPSL